MMSCHEFRLPLPRSLLQEEVGRLEERLAAVCAEKEAAEQRAADAGAAVASAQQIWALHEQLACQQEEAAAACQQQAALSAEVERLSGEVALRDRQLEEQRALLKQVPSCRPTLGWSGGLRRAVAWGQPQPCAVCCSPVWLGEGQGP